MLTSTPPDPAEFVWSLAWSRHLARFLGVALEMNALGKMGDLGGRPGAAMGSAGDVRACIGAEPVHHAHPDSRGRPAAQE